ncbi:unnamed protein product [Orchesella dallaii]|uniref:Major facilitator superfamily (MFS) profile domain-containing protein n=1 Tax=Orchesella dallaii TaxID=48710 RepID=A0ABP1S3K2_9HEXA
MFAGAVVSIQGPFFPEVARSKGASSTESGLVFGIFEFVKFIMAPIYGKLLGGRLNMYKVLNSGIATTSICCVTFGYLHLIQGRTAFIASSVIVRFIEAVGDSAAVTAGFAIIISEFPNAVATTFAIMETFYGIGMIGGPVLGGCLYELGGYSFTFSTIGILLMISACVIYYLFILNVDFSQKDKAEMSTTDNNQKNDIGITKILMIPSITLAAFSLFSATSALGFINATLEHHIVDFHLNKFQIGTIFALECGTYALTAPCFGALCDRIKSPENVSVIGAVFIAVGFMMLGPLPYFPIEKGLLVICVGMLTTGIGTGAVFVSSFTIFLQSSLKNGFQDDVVTYSLASGVWTSVVSLGFFAGPLAGGILDDLIGFRCGTIFVISIQISYLVADYSYRAYKGTSRYHHDQYKI